MNTSELRGLLVESIKDVRAGKLDVEQARNISKLAAQLNDSIHSEVRLMRALDDIGKGDTIRPFGTLAVDNKG